MRETKATRADSQGTAHHVDVCLAKPQRERQQKQPQAHSTTNEQRDRPCKPGVGITNETAPEDPGPEKQNSEQRKRSCHSPVPRGAKVKLDAALKTGTLKHAWKSRPGSTELAVKRQKTSLFRSLPSVSAVSYGIVKST